MSAAFDPYHKWLGIPPAEQPPHHYRLLGLAVFEHDADVIEIAADQRMALLRSFHTGPHSDLSQRLLNEVAAARLCLLKPDRRERYDEVLRARLNLKQPPTVFDAVHERKNPPPPAASPAAKAPPPIISAATTKPPAAPPVIKPPLLTPAAAPPVLNSSAGTSASTAAKPAAAVKATGESPTTAIAVKSPTQLAKPAATAPGPIELIGKSAKKTREIELAPKSNDWDLAIAEACSTQSVVHRRRRRWHINQSLIQFAIAAGLIAGMVYGGAFAFRKWQDYEAKRANEALLAKKNRPPPPPVVSTTTTIAPIESPPDDSSVNQPDNQRHEAPNFSSRQPNDPRPSPNQNEPPNSTGADFSRYSPNAQRPAETGYDSGGRRPVPDAEAQLKAGAEIDDILKSDYQQAAAVSKSDFARKLVRLGEDTHDDLAKHYVLDDRALTLAVGACDVTLAAEVVRDMIATFQLDTWELRVSTIKKLANVAGSPPRKAEIAEAARSLIDEAISEDRYDTALDMANLSFRLAGGVKAVALRDQAHDAIERIKQIQKRLPAVEAAHSALAASPDDPEANLTVGRFECFMKQAWQAGLPHLAKSSDQRLRRLAEREATPPLGPDGLSLADAWWDLAAERDDPKNELEIKAMRVRAAYWYRQAMSYLSGISQEKARRRTEGL